MSGSRIDRTSEPDQDVPELGEDFFARAKRGRPEMLPSERKQRVTICLSPEIVEYFKAGGRGWQTRLNDELAELVKRRRGDKPKHKRPSRERV